MPGRLLAIGDIHGCDVALATLLSILDLQPTDTVVLIGDVVDRGPGTRQSIDLLIELGRRVNLVFVMGNHEEMMLKARDYREWANGWLNVGGRETVESYGGNLERVPAEHIEFLRSAVNYFETDTEVFVHANLEPGVALQCQEFDWLRWTRLTGSEPPLPSGKRVVCGHTHQGSGLPLVIPGWVCIDTWAYSGLYLTCIDVAANRVFQTRQTGESRSFALDDVSLAQR